MLFRGRFVHRWRNKIARPFIIALVKLIFQPVLVGLCVRKAEEADALDPIRRI